MIEFKHQIRVRYAQVDQMGFLYHANYVAIFDEARTEMIRWLGVSNYEIEQDGIMIPVLNVNINYINPAYYDDILTVKVMIKESPRIKSTFHYEIYREDTLITTGSVTVGFMSSKTKKACRPPKKLFDVINNMIDKS